MSNLKLLYMLKVLQFLFLFYAAFSFGQDLHWGHQFGDSDMDRSTDVLTDDDGYVYVAINFIGDIDLNPSGEELIISSESRKDGVIAKYSRDGELVWFVHFESISDYAHVKDIELDASGRLIVLGEFEGSMRVINETEEVHTTEVMSATSFICEFDTDGEFASLKALDLGVVRGFTIDAENNRYVYGYFLDTYTFESGVELTAALYDGFVLKLNSDNTLLWVKQFAATEFCRIHKVEVNADNELVVLGLFRSEVDCNPSAAEEIFSTTSANSDMFVVKLDYDGEFIWSGQLTGWGELNMGDLAVDELNNIYIVGAFYNTADFDPGVGEFNMTSSGTGAFVCKWNNDREFVWGQQIEREVLVSSYDRILIKNGLLYLGGFLIGGSYDFNPDPDEEDIMITTGVTDCFVHVLGNDGEFVNVFPINGLGFGDVSAIAVDDLNNIYASGSFTNTLNFEPGMDEVESSGEADVFFLKYGFSFASVPVESEITFNVFPNPSNGNFFISTPEDSFSIQIHALDGKLVYEEVSGIGKKQLTPNLVKGAYVIRITTANRVYKDILIVNG